MRQRRRRLVEFMNGFRGRRQDLVVLFDESLADEFDKLWNDAGINGLKGHRSVGGYRASMYNALPLESVQVLTETMKELARVKA